VRERALVARRIRKEIHLITLALLLMIWSAVMVRLIGVKHLAEAMDNWLLVLVGYNSLTKKIFLADLRAEERAISRNL